MDREKLKNRIAGCLMAGALGDALGYEVEFLPWRLIKSKYGEGGIRRPALTQGKALISDDTQMTLFTNEGLLLPGCFPDRIASRGTAGDAYLAYLCWLRTQTGLTLERFDHTPGSWAEGLEEWEGLSELMRLPEMHDRRAPGNTCLNALRSGQMGTVEKPINHSKGCGGVMRAAPAGFLPSRGSALYNGAAVAAVTHGHAGGWVPAGMLADMVSQILYEAPQSLEQTVETALSRARTRWETPDAAAACDVVERAIDLSHTDMPDVQAIHSLGGGWVGDEALAIAVFCCLRHPDSVTDALISAVNHDGDSDSTGAVAGNIIGAYLGFDSLPQDWIKDLELADEILRQADLAAQAAQDCPLPSASRDVETAQAWAWERHQGQTDKAGLPYVTHPERVAARMERDEEKVVAWLHDTIEDTGLTHAEIERQFGPVTAEAVDAISRGGEESWDHYLVRVKADPLARAVKISDLIDNSNLSRIPAVTLADVKRQKKYNRALFLLME